MARYLTNRLLAMIPMLIGVTIISFFIMNLAPGDPAAMYIDPTLGNTNPAVLEQIREQMGLNKPIIVRYFIWLGELLQGNLGYSFLTRQPVLSEIGSRIGNTVLLASTALVISLVLGVAIGVYSALNQYKVSDYVITVLTFIGISLPGFWIAMMLILLFTSRLGWLPSVGMSDVMLRNPTPWQSFVDLIRHMILPVTVLSLAQIASWARYQRSSFLEVIEQDYIRTARSKGLKGSTVTNRHALRNAMLPIITLLGLAIPNLIGGAFVVETIFAWPGMGRLGTNAIYQMDYPIVMGVILFSSILVLVGNLLADVLYSFADPQIRYQ